MSGDPRPRLTICAVGASTSVHVVNRVRAFAQRGHRVYLLCERRIGLDGITELVPAAPRAAAGRLSTRGVPAVRVLREAARLVEACAPDIVHVHYAYSRLAWAALAIARHPLVVTVMGGDVLFGEQGRPTRLGRALTVALLREADLITAKSDHLLARLNRLGRLGEKAVPVVWGVDLTRFRRTPIPGLRETFGVEDADPVILSPRILQPFYNVHLIVQAMPHVLDKHPRARLLVTEYGASAAYRRQLAAQAEALGVSGHVRFVGQVPHEAMPGLFSVADVAVGVPFSDGLPQTMLEAMACEVPNILTRLPHYDGFVHHQESAYFVDPTPDGVAAGILALLGDAELRRRIVTTALDIVRRRGSFEADVARVEHWYHQLLGRRHRGRWTSRMRALINVAVQLAGGR